MAVDSFEVIAAPETPSTMIVVDGLSADDLRLPDGEMALRATFTREGPDLLIEGRGGEQVLVQDYFANEEPRDLILGDGSGVLAGSLVATLAGSATPGQYAQLETTSLTEGAVGQVEALTGEAFAVRVDGTRVALEVGSPIYMGDVLETTFDGAIAVLFVDGTTFSLAEDARMVVDELIYDAGSEGNTASFSLVQGLFVLVSGDITKTGEMTIETPVSTIGIRGTSAAIQSAADGLENIVTLLQDPNGNVGLIEVATAVATVILSEIGATTTVASLDQAPSAVEILQGADIEALYRAALATMQALSDADLGVTNNLSNETQDGEDVGVTIGLNGSAPGDDGAGETTESQASPADPNAAVAAFAAAVEGLFQALAAAIEEAEIENAQSGPDPVTGVSAGDDESNAGGAGELVSLPEKDGNDNPVGNIAGEPADAPDEPVNVIPDPPAPDVIVAGGEAFLQGTYIELGIAANGTIGTTGAPPPDFAASELDGVGLSFFGDNEPLDNDGATTGDVFLPGSPIENFTIAFADGAGAFVGSNENAGQGTDIAMEIDSTSSGGGVQSVTTSGGVDGRLDVSQTVELGQNDTFYTTTVTFTNAGDETVTGLRYMRSGDPDLGSGTFNTLNDVLLRPDNGGVAAVDAQGPNSGQSVMLLADQAALNAANGLSDGSIQVQASAFGFENLNPFDPRAFDNPSDPDGASGDIGINLVYTLPDLEPGESVTISWVTSINTPSDGNDILVVRSDETGVDGGNGDDVIFASRDDTAETLNGGNGSDQLFAMSDGSSGDILDGGNGRDVLNSGGGADQLTGGNGPDFFVYDDADDGFTVDTNTTFSELVDPQTDVIVDFKSGVDTIQLLSSIFGDMAPGDLVNGVNFSVVNDSYDGTNAGANLNHGLGLASFVYSVADNTLHFDGNGADAGYTAVANMDQPSASDVEVVAAA